MISKSGRWAAAFAVLAGALVAGCTDQVGGTPLAAAPATQGPVDGPTTSSSPAPSGGQVQLDALPGTWEGTYVCAQGETGMRLVVDQPADEITVAAVFEFFPVPSNPDTDPGSYRMTGLVESGQLTFVGEEWIERPPGYVLVDLMVTSTVTEGVDTLSGVVTDPACQTFTARRR